MRDDVLWRSMSVDIQNSLAAMKRAAQRARELGKTSGTGIVVQRNGRLVQVSSDAIIVEPDHDVPNDGNA